MLPDEAMAGWWSFVKVFLSHFEHGFRCFPMKQWPCGGRSWNCVCRILSTVLGASPWSNSRVVAILLASGCRPLGEWWVPPWRVVVARRTVISTDFGQLPITVFHATPSRNAISIVIFTSDNQKDRARERERTGPLRLGPLTKMSWRELACEQTYFLNR